MGRSQQSKVSSCLKNACFLSCWGDPDGGRVSTDLRTPFSTPGVRRPMPQVPEFSPCDVRTATVDAGLQNLHIGNDSYAPVNGVRQGPFWYVGRCGMSLNTKSVPLNFLYSGPDGQLKRWSPRSAPLLRGYGPGSIVFEQQGGTVLYDEANSMGSGKCSPGWYYQRTGLEGGPSSRMHSPYPGGQSGTKSPTRPSMPGYLRGESTPPPKSARDWLEDYIAGSKAGSVSTPKNTGAHSPNLSTGKMVQSLEASASCLTSSIEDSFNAFPHAGRYTPTGSCTPECTTYGGHTPTSAFSGSPSDMFSMVGGFDPLSIQFVHLLGRGNFSTVYKTTIDGMDFALKIVRNPVSSGTEALAGFMSKNVLHPNLVRICGVQNVTVHCSLDDISGAKSSLEQQSYSSEKEGMHAAHISSQAAHRLKTEASTSGVSDMFSDLARNLPQQGGAGREDMEAWILMEYCDTGTLEKAIDKGQFCENGRFEKPKMLHVLFAALEIASAMTHLHSCGIIHGDLKPENVLLQGCDPSPVGIEFTCKVGDFGLSRRTSIHSSQIDTFSCGTVTHMAPEVLRDNILTYSADTFSFGVLLWELMTGKKPFVGQSQSGTILSIVEGRRPIIPAYFPPWYAQLVEDCWHQNRHARPKFADIVERINLMVLAFERPRLSDPFVSATFSSNHSDMIVAYQGSQQFMEGDLHTNPFYEHADTLYESSSALCIPEGVQDVSISFDNMQCGTRSNGIMHQFSPKQRRAGWHRSNKEQLASPIPESPAESEEAATSSSPHCTGMRQEAKEYKVPTAQVSGEPLNVSAIHNDPEDPGAQFRNSQNHADSVEGTMVLAARHCTVRVSPGDDNVQVTVNRASNMHVSTERSFCPSSCDTPLSASDIDSDFGSWSPPHRRGAPEHCIVAKAALSDEDLASTSRSSVSNSAEGTGAIKPLERGSINMNSLSRMPVQKRSGMELVSHQIRFGEHGNDLSSVVPASRRKRRGGTSWGNERGMSLISPVKIKDASNDPPLHLSQVSNPIIWDTFMTPPASDYLSGRDSSGPCVVYNRYT